jgi:hypothetical protein
VLGGPRGSAGTLHLAGGALTAGSHWERHSIVISGLSSFLVADFATNSCANSLTLVVLDV